MDVARGLRLNIRPCQDGFLRSAPYGRNNELIDGEARNEAAKQLGLGPRATDRPSLSLDELVVVLVSIASRKKGSGGSED